MNQYPQTLEEAVTLILNTIDLGFREIVRNTPEEELILFHHGWGAKIRSEFGLWGKNAALLANTGELHPDSAAMVIIRAVWRALQSDVEALETGEIAK